MANWSLQDAKNSFSAVVQAALRGQPQRVSRHGKPAVVVVNAEDFDRLITVNASAAPSFAEFLLAIPQDDCSFERRQLKPRDFSS